MRFYDSNTGELLVEHELKANGVGRFVQIPKNADRFRETKYDSLKVKVLEGFCGLEPAEMHVGRIMERYPRYIRDQLSIIDKLQKVSNSIISLFGNLLYFLNSYINFTQSGQKNCP